MALRTYEVNVKGQSWAKNIVHASPGAAKYAYLLDIREAYPEVKFMHLTCRSLGRILPDASFTRVAKYRGVPYAELGMRVRLGGEDGDYGVLVGSNSSSNFEVLFETGPHKGAVLSCHPNFMIAYINSADQVIGEFRG